MVERKTYRLSGGMFDREAETSDVKRLFFLSVEGVSTEPSYFRNLNRVLKDLGVKNIMLHVLKHPNDGLSSPEDVYALLEECRDLRSGGGLLPVPVIEGLKDEFGEDEIRAYLEGGCIEQDKVRKLRDILLNLGVNMTYRKFIQSAPSSEDRFVVVIDRDSRSHSRRCIEDVMSKCKEKGFVFCLTNPCFEFWLLLHLVDAEGLQDHDEMDRIAANEKVSVKHTYVSKRVSDIARHAKRIPAHTFDRLYKPNISKAINSSGCFAATAEAVIESPGSTMPLLMSDILHDSQISEAI